MLFISYKEQILNFYKSLFRPILFSIDPEKAQHVAQPLLNNKLITKMAEKIFEYDNRLLNTKIGGISIPNPIGLAAGFDKDCRSIPGLEALGFGYVTVGTVTKDPRYGNPKPRIARLHKKKALVNSLGFPGNGLKAAISKFQALNPSQSSSKRVISISGTDVNDIRDCHKSLEPFVSAVEINISSPNTSGLKIFQEPQNLRNLVETIQESRNKPLFVKLPPFDAVEQGKSQEQIFNLAEECVKSAVDAVTISNTWPVKDTSLAIGQGGLSGAPLFENTIAMVKTISKEFGANLDINACGGIATGQQAYQALLAGASSVQLYTSLIYEGPSLIKTMKKDLAGEIQKNQN